MFVIRAKYRHKRKSSMSLGVRGGFPKEIIPFGLMLKDRQGPPGSGWRLLRAGRA